MWSNTSVPLLAEILTLYEPGFMFKESSEMLSIDKHLPGFVSKKPLTSFESNESILFSLTSNNTTLKDIVVLILD